MATDGGTTDGGTGGDGAARQQPALPSDPVALEALISRRRESLAATIDELVVRAHPKEIARRSAADARSRVQSFATTPEGQPRVERLAAVAAAALALVALFALAKRRDRRRAGKR